MVKAVKPRRQTMNPDQIPLITPDSSWRVPDELPDLSMIDDIAIDTEEKDWGIIQGRGAGWAFKSRTAAATAQESARHGDRAARFGVSTFQSAIQRPTALTLVVPRNGSRICSSRRNSSVAYSAMPDTTWAG
jgi:hypothetical protein